MFFYLLPHRREMRRAVRRTPRAGEEGGRRKLAVDSPESPYAQSFLYAPDTRPKKS
jgi:hypothetical protein